MEGEAGKVDPKGSNTWQSQSWNAEHATARCHRYPAAPDPQTHSSRRSPPAQGRDPTRLSAYRTLGDHRGGAVRAAGAARAVRTHRAGGEQPPDDGPARQDVGAEHLVGRVHHAADVTDEVAAQGLAVRGGQVLPLEPVLVPLLLPEPHLKGKGKVWVFAQEMLKAQLGTTRPAAALSLARGEQTGWMCMAVSTDKSSVLSPSSSRASRTALLLSEL